MSDVEHWSQRLFDKPIKRVVGGYDDPNRSYEFDITDLVQVNRNWYIVRTTGCSCPSYEEMAFIECGPAPLKKLRKYMETEYPQKCYDEMRDDVIAAIDVILKEKK